MPGTPTTPTSPSGSGPSSVRAIVDWLETAGAVRNGGGAGGKAGGKAAAKPGGPIARAKAPPAPQASTAAAAAPVPRSPLGRARFPAAPTPDGRRKTGEAACDAACDAANPTEHKGSTLPQHEACASPSSLRTKTGSVPDRHDKAKAKDDGAPRSSRQLRSKQEIDDFWSAVRGVLFIADEEIYGP